MSTGEWIFIAVMAIMLGPTALGLMSGLIMYTAVGIAYAAVKLWGWLTEGIRHEERG